MSSNAESCRAYYRRNRERILKQKRNKYHGLPPAERPKKKRTNPHRGVSTFMGEVHTKGHRKCPACAAQQAFIEQRLATFKWGEPRRVYA